MSLSHVIVFFPRMSTLENPTDAPVGMYVVVKCGCAALLASDAVALKRVKSNHSQCAKSGLS